MPDDLTLTKVERLMLINQFRILEALGPDETSSYAEQRTILEDGYESYYDWKVFGQILSPTSCEEGTEVLDTLTMFDAIRNSLPEGASVDDYPHSRFNGYSGNEETKSMAFARFSIEGLGKFSSLPLRETDPWNSHFPMREVYGRMLAEWRKVPETDRFDMSEDQLRSVMDAARHPDAD
ncbi:MAG: YfbU family protein [Rhodobacteraceae bacterium]|nr:YfbU family protein [Paracoccaceae bacterium]